MVMNCHLTDNWFCKGWRVEYSAASDAFTGDTIIKVLNGTGHGK